MNNLTGDKRTVLVLRPPRKHWIIQVAVVFGGLLTFCVGLTYLFAGYGRLAARLIWFIFAGIAFWDELLPIWQTRITVSKDTLTGRVGTYEFQVRWADLVAAKISKDVQSQLNLWLVTDSGVYLVPLKYLDAKQLWQQITEHVDPGRLGESAYERWQVSQESSQGTSLASSRSEQRIGTLLRARRKWWIVALGWFAVIFFCYALVVMWLPDSPDLPLPVLLTGLLIPLAFPDWTEMDTDKVTHVTPPFGRYQMRWDQVRRIEYRSSNLDLLVFYGDGKRLVTSSPRLWAVRGGQAIQSLLFTQAQQRGIEIGENSKSHLFMLSKNTRVRRRR
jgi:hypothetical protein